MTIFAAVQQNPLLSEDSRHAEEKAGQWSSVIDA
jgi:hypothetical protein